jgi:hypothetical protein
MIVGYDPTAIARLERNTRSALAALRAVHSSDPAAAQAMSAVLALRRALDDDILPAVAAIATRNPLAHSFGWPAHDITGRIASTGTGRTRRATPWSGASNADLIDAVRDMSPEERTPGRPIGGLTQTQFDALVREFERRAATDQDFAQLLIDEPGTPLLGDIVLAGSFPDDVVLGVLYWLLASAPSYGKEQVYRDEAIAKLLTEIVARPDLALDVLSDVELMERIFTVNVDRFTNVVSPELLADLIVVGMLAAPKLDPQRRDDAVRALANLVELAQDDVFKSGFEAPVAQALAIAFGAYVDEFTSAASHDCFIDMVGDVRIPLGTRDEVIEFFGSLVYDPTSRAILAAILQDAAERSIAGSTPFSLVDVSALSVLINDAVDNENVELEELSDKTAGFIKFGFDLLNLGVKKVLSTTGVGALASLLVSFGIQAAEDAATGSVNTRTTGAPNFAQIGDLLIRFEIIRAAVYDPDVRRRGTTAAEVREAKRLVDEVAAMFDDPTATYADIERSVTQLERDLADVLDLDELDARVNASKYVPRPTNSASNVCDTDFPN